MRRTVAGLYVLRRPHSHTTMGAAAVMRAIVLAFWSAVRFRPNDTARPTRAAPMPVMMEIGASGSDGALGGGVGPDITASILGTVGVRRGPFDSAVASGW